MGTNLVISGGGAFQPLKEDTKRLAEQGIDHIYTASSGFVLSDKDYQNLKSAFIDFCQKNKNAICPMLMFTGLHGEYTPATCHNLNEAQVDELVWIARSHQITFQHIYFDNCCAAFGMSKFMTLLTVGGQAYGDRLSSQGYFFQNELNQYLLQKKSLNYIDIAQNGLRHRSSPLVIKRRTTGQVYDVFGEEETSAIKRLSEKLMLLFGCQSREELTALGDVFNVHEIQQDFLNSRLLLNKISLLSFEDVINSIALPQSDKLNQKVTEMYSDLQKIQQSLDYLKTALPQTEPSHLTQWQVLSQSLTALLALIQETTERSHHQTLTTSPSQQVSA